MKNTKFVVVDTKQRNKIKINKKNGKAKKIKSLRVEVDFCYLKFVDQFGTNNPQRTS